jgi:hypothetical protein
MIQRRLIVPLLGAFLTLAFAGATPARAQTQGVQATFGNLIAALNNINVQIDDLQVIDDVTIGDVTVVDARNLLRGANINALNNALNRNEVNVLSLRNVLNNNDVLNNALNDLNIDINSVIAVLVLNGGDLVIFTF